MPMINLSDEMTKLLSSLVSDSLFETERRLSLAEKEGGRTLHLEEHSYRLHEAADMLREIGEQK